MIKISILINNNTDIYTFVAKYFECNVYAVDSSKINLLIN